MWFRYGLKAQKLLAQGNTLGISAISPAPRTNGHRRVAELKIAGRRVKQR